MKPFEVFLLRSDLAGVGAKQAEMFVRLCVVRAVNLDQRFIISNHSTRAHQPSLTHFPVCELVAFDPGGGAWGLQVRAVNLDQSFIISNRSTRAHQPSPTHFPVRELIAFDPGGGAGAGSGVGGTSRAP